MGSHTRYSVFIFAFKLNYIWVIFTVVLLSFLDSLSLSTIIQASQLSYFSPLALTPCLILYDRVWGFENMPECIGSLPQCLLRLHKAISLPWLITIIFSRSEWSFNKMVQVHWILTTRWVRKYISMRVNLVKLPFCKPKWSNIGNLYASTYYVLSIFFVPGWRLEHSHAVLLLRIS